MCGTSMGMTSCIPGCCAQLSAAGFERVRAAGVPGAVLPVLGGTFTGCCAVAYPEVLYQVGALHHHSWCV